METSKLKAVRNNDCDFNDEGKMRFCATLESVEEVLDYVYFDTENDCHQFITYYNFK